MRLSLGDSVFLRVCGVNAGSLELSSQLAMLKAFRCRENMTRAGVNFVKNDIPLAFDSKQLTDGGKGFFFWAVTAHARRVGSGLALSLALAPGQDPGC